MNKIIIGITALVLISTISIFVIMNDNNKVEFNEQQNDTTILNDESDLNDESELNEDVAEDSFGLENVIWSWEKTVYENDDTNIVKPFETGVFSITFEDQNVYGSTDCNNFMGSYELDENKISFGPLAMTLMYCEGSQESDFMNMINSVDSAALNNEELLLYSLDESIVMYFNKIN